MSDGAEANALPVGIPGQPSHAADDAPVHSPAAVIAPVKSQPAHDAAAVNIDKATTESSTATQERRSRGAEPPPPSTKEVPWTRLFALAKPESHAVIAAFALMVLSEGLSLYTPLLLGNAYNYVINPAVAPADRMASINRTMIIVIILHLCGCVASWCKAFVLGATGERVVARLRNDLFGSILKQEIAFFDEHKTGELVSRLSSDTTLLQQATSQALPEVILGIVKLTVSIALMFWISPSLAGVTIGAVVVVFGMCMPFGKWMAELSKRYQDVLGSAQNVSTEALGAMRTVQAFAAEDRERTRYRAWIGDPSEFRFWWPTHREVSADEAKKVTTYYVGFFKALVTASFFTIVFGLGFGSLYICLWYGFKLVNDQVITLGALTAFQSYVFQIGAGLGQTSNFIAQLVQARGASGRIFFLLDRIPEIPKPRDHSNPPDEEGGTLPDDDASNSEHPEPRAPTVTIDALQGQVEFHNVDFTYPSRPDVPVLRQFNLVIPPNTTAALVGSSGAGKSTVVALLQRFYDVSSGSITIDGKDIRDLDLRWLRSRTGFVQQEPALFGMTCRENVLYGVDREVSQAELEEVCRQASCESFIREWPDGYDTLVGERGVKLSGGQKQRLSIARALLVNPRILLLDEATSALDAESEHLVQQAIQKAVVGRTVLIVAHRLSTIQSADQIVVLDNCQIVDVGRHSELLERCGKYQDLIKRQSMVGTLPPSVSLSEP
jgi:ABC-type multidrug transport system fused ATPase/permease subunit